MRSHIKNLFFLLFVIIINPAYTVPEQESKNLSSVNLEYKGVLPDLYYHSNAGNGYFITGNLSNVYTMTFGVDEQLVVCDHFPKQFGDHISQTSHPCYLGNGYFTITDFQTIRLMHIDALGKIEECDRYEIDHSIQGDIVSLGNGLFAYNQSHKKYVHLMLAENGKLIKLNKVMLDLTTHQSPYSIGNGYFVVLSQYGQSIYLLYANRKGELKICDEFETGEFFEYLTDVSGDGYFTISSSSNIYRLQVNPKGKLQQKSKYSNDSFLWAVSSSIGDNYFVTGSRDLHKSKIRLLRSDKNHQVKKIDEYTIKGELDIDGLFSLGNGLFATVLSEGKVVLMQSDEKGLRETGKCIIDENLWGASKRDLGLGYFLICSSNNMHIFKASK